MDADEAGARLRSFALLFAPALALVVAIWTTLLLEMHGFMIVCVVALPLGLMLAAPSALRLDAPRVLRWAYVVGVVIATGGAVVAWAIPTFAGGVFAYLAGMVYGLIFLLFAGQVALLLGLALLTAAALRLRRARRGFQQPARDEFGLAGR